MNAVLDQIATRVPAPVLVDSTEADVIEEALKRIPGKPLINSINLEDGEKRTSKVLPMARRYGAAVIALTIDEDGMALTAQKKWPSLVEFLNWQRKSMDCAHRI